MSITSCDQIKLTVMQSIPPTDKISEENITLAERLVSSDDGTGIGMFRFGPYYNRLKANYELSLYTISETANTLDFNICMSSTLITNNSNNVINLSVGGGSEAVCVCVSVCLNIFSNIIMDFSFYRSKSMQV